ncbi:hypothetical protein GCM10010232_30770 [Streptomyces amakusaensis]|uniref:Secreted protein n=1 Tax=Streptomyces amakusaensis TaxID=67271 RepID=A0ABW0AEB1_9ACTN
MICHKRTATVAFAALFLAVSAAGAAQSATAAPHPVKKSAGEVDRNLLKPPPGGALQPVTDVVGKIVPGLPA